MQPLQTKGMDLHNLTQICMLYTIIQLDYDYAILELDSLSFDP